MNAQIAKKKKAPVFLILVGAFFVATLSFIIAIIAVVLVAKYSPESLEYLGVKPQKVIIHSSKDCQKSCPQCPKCDSDTSIPYPLMTIFPETLEIEGEIPRDTVLKLLNAKRPMLRECYASELKNDRDLKGEFGLQFTAIQNGNVRVAVENKTSFASKKVKQCILDEVKGWKFDTKTKGLNVVRVDILFAPVTNTGTY